MDDTGYMPCRGYLDRLEVCNFKSYRGVQAIGPFKDFTAVVGPNGSGKSNLMDAISFVLGVRTNQLRGNQLRELLYSNSDGSSEEDKPRKGFVKLVFMMENDGGSLDEVVFSRIIQPSGSAEDAAPVSVYKIDNKTVTWEAYSQKLSSFGVLVKIRNFLVFQGDIEAVAAKSPAGLTLLFEQISGSEGLKKSYAEFGDAKTKAEERMSIAFGKKKAVAAEKKLKKEQKEEAEAHMKRQADLLDMKSELALFQLFHIENEREDVKREKSKLDAQLEQIDANAQHFDSNMAELKKKHAGHAKDRLLLEKKMKKLQAERDKKAPSLIAAKEEMVRVNKRLKVGETELAELRSKATDKGKAIAKLEKEMAKCKEARKKLDAEVQAHYAKHTKAGLQAAGVQEEYNQIKADVGGKTAKTVAERDALSAQHQADREALSQVQADVAQLRARAASLSEQADEQRTRAEAAKVTERESKRMYKEKRDELGQLGDKNRKKNAERMTLDRRLDEVNAALADARADRRESQRDRRMSEAVASLKRLFPGVHGRLTELGKVTQRAYNLALSVAMGRDIDAVIVDNERTARDCIQYLKEQQIPPLTFIPLATCKVQPISDRLRSLGGTAKLAVDLVEFDSALERAFLFVFGNTLVCDGVDEARQLAFGGAERHKVVSKDGTQFSKQGLITGGTSHNADQRAARWDESAIATLKKEREDLQQKLQETSNVHALRQMEQSINSECAALESKARFSAEEARMTLERANRLQTDAATCEKNAAKREPEIARLGALLEEREKRISALTERVNEVTDKLFASFSSRMGVANIREYEEQHAAFEEASGKERAKLDQQESKVQTQLDYERSRDLEGPATKKQQELARDKERVEELKAAQAAHADDLEAAEKEITVYQEQESGNKIELDKIEADMSALKKRAASVGTERAKIGKLQTQLEATMEQLDNKAADLLKATEMEQIELPRKYGAKSQRMDADQRETPGSSLMDVDAAGPSGGAEDPQALIGAVSVDVDKELADLNFSELPRSLSSKNLPAKDREATERELQKRIAEMAAELETAAPNMKAVEQFEVVKDKEREINAALEQARQDTQAAAEAFRHVHQQRYDMFMAAFNHISKEIDVIYKDLTSSTVHPLGGTAYLSLEDSDEPFLAGTKYNAMPPTKRFRDMEQLSGGEKTVAALALLFAIHSYRPSPFFVLDEVDAALDATNVARVAHYIRKKSRPNGQSNHMPFQSIVISLKDIFYEKADVLVGVARDVEKSCSKTFTFDLSKFEAPQEADAR